MTWLAILKIALQLAAYFADRAKRADIQKAVLNELEILHGKRVREATVARDDVLAGRVPPDPLDPYRRD
jgi:hypothetical protein